ncbi:hypothetical protein IAQ61_003564 [Plenodomus lingam]|uniref:uncharacterized protein n=1 Tax=Leptosphaeria maculans TaxID=5022 RepID=UPI003316FA43|nr:hypothetical protein IAQ61_003564 [Plenodomus lingam]
MESHVGLAASKRYKFIHPTTLDQSRHSITSIDIESSDSHLGSFKAVQQDERGMLLFCPVPVSCSVLSYQAHKFD